MAIKDQFMKVKENWLLIVLFIVLVLIVSGGSSINPLRSITSSMDGGMFAEKAMYDSNEDMAYSRSMVPSYGGQDFAPEEEERKITKTASISSKVNRGQFDRAERDLKSSVLVANGLILNENVYEYGNSNSRSGNYQIKVPTDAYDTIVAELKTIGEVTNFNENTQDITGNYLSAEARLSSEKSRLERFEKLYEESERIEDKIQLDDRIFNQERTIKYIEENLENLDRRITYTTISVNIQEEESTFATIVFVKFSELVKGFVDSLSGLFIFVVWLLPWAIAVAIITFFYRIYNRKKRKK